MCVCVCVCVCVLQFLKQKDRAQIKDLKRSNENYTDWKAE